MFLQLSFCMIPLLRGNLDLLSIWIFLITIAYLHELYAIGADIAQQLNQFTPPWMTLQGFHQFAP